MEAAIRQRGQDETLKELVLDGLKFKEVTVGDAKLLESFTSLESLCCNRTGLKSLENFPPIDSLVRLHLCDNGMNASCGLHNLSALKNLRVLLLSGNKFKTIEELDPLSSLKNLEILELFLNPLCAMKDYRKICFEKFPNLLVIDNEDKLGNEVDVDDSDSDSDSDDEEDEDEDDENTNGIPITSLKDFYEKDISDGDDGGEDYEPGDKENEQDDDEDIDDESDDEEEDTEM